MENITGILAKREVQKVANILACDDDKDIVEAISIYLEQEGYTIFKAYDGLDAINILHSQPVDLLIIDIMMPKLDGIRATLKIREENPLPIIILSAKSEDADKILGLNVGADDYVTKPFNPMELVARIKAQIRRFHQYNESSSDSEIFESAGLEVNNATHTCTLYGELLTLTPIEFGILWLLCKNANKVVSTEEIFEKVWGEKYLDSNNTVMVHIRRLREKMHEKTRNPKFIKTVWGVGYKIETQ